MKRLLIYCLLLTLSVISYPQVTLDLNDVFTLNPSTAWVAGYGGVIYKTSDGGLSWNECYRGYNINRIYFHNEFTGFAVGPNGIIIKSSDGGLSWGVQASGTLNGLNYILTLDHLTAVAVGDSGVILRTSDGGINWTKIITPATYTLTSICFRNGSLGLISGGGLSSDGKILKTTDSGLTWTEVYSSTSMSIIMCISCLSENSWIAADGNTRILKSTDNGNSWNTIFNPSGFANTVSDMHSFDDNNGIMVGYVRLVHPSGSYAKRWRTIDGGVSWNGYNVPMGKLTAVSFSGSTGYLTGKLDPSIPPVYTTFYKSTDAGYSWNSLSLPVEFISFTAELTAGKILLNWKTSSEKNNRGFEIERRTRLSEFRVIGYVPGKGTTSEIQDYIFEDSDPCIGSNIYRLRQIDFNGSSSYSNETEVEFNSPVSFHLGQNFPNPFNPVTEIRYNIALPGYVKLTIYDMFGSEVLVPVNEYKTVGKYSVIVDASCLSSGVYVYQLQAKGFTSSSKMILLK